MWRELTQRNSCREKVRLLRVGSKHRCVTLCDYNDKPVWFHELARLPREQLVASLMDAILEAVFTSKWANSVCVYVHLTGSTHHIYDPCSKKCEGLVGRMSGLMEGSTKHVGFLLVSSIFSMIVVPEGTEDHNKTFSCTTEEASDGSPLDVQVCLGSLFWCSGHLSSNSTVVKNPYWKDVRFDRRANKGC